MKYGNPVAVVDDVAFNADYIVFFKMSPTVVDIYFTFGLSRYTSNSSTDVVLHTRNGSSLQSAHFVALSDRNRRLQTRLGSCPLKATNFKALVPECLKFFAVKSSFRKP